MIRIAVFAITSLFAGISTAQSGGYCIEKRFSETPYFDSSKIVIRTNQVYSVVPRWPGSGTDTLKLDMYYPDPTADPLAKRPCIVFFYGGAWLNGSKNDAGIRQKCFEWARRGFVVAAPNYRLGWNCAAADLLGVCVLCQGNYYDMNTAVYRGAQDGKAAMRWVSAMSSSYGIDTGALFLGGESAGSFNAMHTAFWTHDYAKKVFNGGPYRLLGSIDSAGQNLGVRFRVRGIINNCGAVAQDTALKLSRTPMVAFHDVTDCVVPFQVNQVLNCCATSFFWARGSNRLYSDLRRSGTAAELHLVKGTTPAHCSYPSITLVKESSCFLKKLLCGLSPSDSLTHPTSPAIICDNLKSLGTKQNRQQNLQIYPVPAGRNLSISSPAGISEAEIYNLQGKRVFRTAGAGQRTHTFDISSLSPGPYMLLVRTTGGQLISGRFEVGVER